ncbi:AHH domain-containing protein [Metabacillus malikii]|uniref:Uncharacterized protein n=1 Tax=Metabacillus malikii TaxID=1504265 RepID=A0ABT9ZMA3_9BACI|nr:AHH domain-containing protein [Metabacillus malikii]MDQ0233408.1 hypothetical protein [Metabacillus malikii]
MKFITHEGITSKHSVRQLANNDTYKDVIGEIKANTRPSIRDLIGFASDVPLSYASMRYPGPWQHLTYLRWNKHKDTITTKYAEWKTASDFTKKVITKEEFDSLAGHIVDVIEIIEGHEEGVTGDYHVYDNGLIVRVFAGAYYEIVDSVPTVKKPTNGKALDSFFEDTPFEIVEYVVNPSTIVSKVFRKKIDDVTVGFVGKKGAKGTGNPKKEKPKQVHHYATNKSKTYTHQLENVTKKYGLELDDAWNKELLPHQGRHPNAYHEYVLDRINEYDAIARGNKEIFLELFEGLKKEVRENPDMLYKEYWLKKK